MSPERCIPMQPSTCGVYPVADTSSNKQRKLKRLFRLGSGYVLDLSDRPFSEFPEEHTRCDLDAAVYRERGTFRTVPRVIATNAIQRDWDNESTPERWVLVDA